MWKQTKSALKTALNKSLGRPTNDLQINFEYLKKTQNEQFPVYFYACGKQFILRENVMDPRTFISIGEISQELPLSKGMTFLEMGCGAGVGAVYAALQGCSKVVAIDINEDAVKNTAENAKLHGVSHIVDARLGNLFSPVKKDEKFDLIFWNVPWIGDDPGKELTPLEMSVIDPDYKDTLRYAKFGRNYLTEKGRLLFGFGASVGDIDKLNEQLIINDMSIALLKTINAVSPVNDVVHVDLYEVII